MTAESIECTNCGAPMNPEFDGRTYACHYCRARVQVAVKGEQIAAGVSADLSNIESFLSKLGSTLTQGFASNSKVQMRGQSVEHIEVNLEPDVFLLHRRGREAVAEHKQVVRGIALKTKELPLDEWYQKLTDALARKANTNSHAAWVLGQLGGGR